MKKSDLARRIEELERRVRDLEARPFVFPQPVVAPVYPQPWGPTWSGDKPVLPYEVTCEWLPSGDLGNVVATSHTTGSLCVRTTTRQ